MSKPEIKHEVYSTECGMWFSEKPRLVGLTDEAYKILEDSDWCGYMGFKEGVDCVEVEQPKTIDNIEGDEEQACRCGSTTWLYNSEGWAVLCKECWNG